MNYYEFYDLAISFHIDKKSLRRKYIQISKACHPDYYVTDSSVNQEQALQKSSFNNEAYRILNDDRERIKYLVSIVLKDSSKKQVPPDFLMEMMDVNEQVMMIAMEEDENAKTILKQKIIGINQGLLDQLSDLTHSYDDTLEIKLLVSIQEVLLKLQYMDRLMQNSQLFS